MASLTKNLEDLTIVWLDVDRIHENRDDYLDTKTRLRQCNNYIEICNDTNKCIDGIKANENVFLIVSGSICETFIPLILEIKHIIFIYVLYSNNKSSDMCELKNTSKIHGIFSNKNQLIEKLKQDIKSYLRSLTPVCIINEKSIRALNKEYSMFMWTQLLLDVLIQIPATNGKMMMLNDCRLQYAGNKKQLAIIDEFEKDYESEFAVWWYTRDSFLYRQLNKALRTQNIDIIFKYRFFVTDLYTQLNQLYNENISSLEETLIVYRGQSISCDELEKIKNNINGLISMNTFLSTTRKKDLALTYAGNGSDRPLYESILFEIKLDKNVVTKSKPLADIKYMSNFGMGEEEILLSMGIIFKIQSVEQLLVENGIVWEVKLTLNESVVNKEIDILFNYLKTNSTTSISNIGTLGLLLGQMGDYRKAKRYYQMILDELPIDHCGIPIIFNNMGILYSDKGDNKKALEYYTKSYEHYKMQNVSENDLLLANLYHNMGSLYYEDEDNETALKYFRKAFEICNKNSSLPSFLLSATLFTDMSGIFEDNGDYDNALDNLRRTLEIQLRILPSNHFRIAATYNNIGGIYLCNRDYETALQNFKMALDIGLKSLPSNHENIQTYREHIKLVEERIK